VHDAVVTMAYGSVISVVSVETVYMGVGNVAVVAKVAPPNSRACRIQQSGH